MFVIREPTVEDIDAILEVAVHLDTVNLPAERENIAETVARSIASFSGTIEPTEREFLFVLEDVEHRRILGTSMIIAQHGTRRSPHIYLDVIKDERYSETLDRYFVHECLRLGYNYHGPTEIGGLILHPEYRRHPERLGTLLSYVRFVFIAGHRELFRDHTIAELLPPLGEDGTSLVWQHFGRRFTGLSYQKADKLSRHNKEFIRALFPHTRIYTALFPQEVRDVIGVVGPSTKGVERMLRRVGFSYANQIDPFDGGPHFVAKTDEITLVAGTQQLRVETTPSADASRPVAILAAKTPKFQAVCGRVIPGDGCVGLTAVHQQALGVESGDMIWVVYLP